MSSKEDKILSFLLDKAKNLPITSGCYLMKNKEESVIYVGKAKNLRSRVKSYFDSSSKTIKTQFLVSHIVDFDFILTKTDAEAFVLENNLIKKHNPKYNIRLKDDKSYPYIVVDKDEEFPRLKYVRRPKKKSKREFFGPFPFGGQISLVSRILTKTFKLRDCSLREFQTRKTPCLLYQMNQCSAPCVKYISKEDYEKDLQIALNFLRGRTKAVDVLKIVEDKMNVHSEKEEYELAAMMRDNYFQLEQFLNGKSEQKVELVKDDSNIDIVAFYESETDIDLCIYTMRKGILLGQKSFILSKLEMIDEWEDELIRYILLYYTSSHEELPQTLCLDLTDEKMELLQKALDKLFESEKKSLKVILPKTKFKNLFELTQRQAEENCRLREQGKKGIEIALNKLKELLGLKKIPEFIECYDVAIWQGKSPTASQVVFRNGGLDKTLYRYYHLNERPEGNNDFAMMAELIERRIDNGDLPELFLIDGGKAQVSTVLKVLKDNDITIPVIGIAKSKSINAHFSKAEVEKSEERLIIPNRSNPYVLSKNPSLLKLCVLLRNEAHRFSRKLHHHSERKRIFHSWLDEVSGIGEKTKEKMLSRMDLRPEEIRQLSVSAIQTKFEVTELQAQNIKKYLSEKF